MTDPVDDRTLAELENELHAAERELRQKRAVLLKLRAGSADARRVVGDQRTRGRAFRWGLGVGLGFAVLMVGFTVAFICSSHLRDWLWRGLLV